MVDPERLLNAMQAERWLVFALGVWGGIFMIRSAISARSRAELTEMPRSGNEESEQRRIKRADDARERVPAMPHYILAGLSFGTACVLLANVVPPTVAYALLCLVLAGRSIVDQVAEERASRRRSTILGRSRRVDPVLLIWIVLAALSALLLVPWALARTDRFAAIIVTACAATMVAVAWRIANAPPLLLGNDLEAEQIVDRETRAIRTGKVCFFAIAASAMFLSFGGSSVASAIMILGLGLFIWVRWYAYRLSRTPLES